MDGGSVTGEQTGPRQNIGGGADGAEPRRRARQAPQPGEYLAIMIVAAADPGADEDQRLRLDRLEGGSRRHHAAIAGRHRQAVLAQHFPFVKLPADR